MDKKTEYRIAEDTSSLAVKGAVAGRLGRPAGAEALRSTRQPLLPVEKAGNSPEGYDIFPAYPLPGSSVHTGHDSLAEWMGNFSQVVIEGYSGVYWSHFTENMNRAFQQKGIRVNWFCIDAALKDEKEVDALKAPFLGGEDPVFGRIYPGQLADFFEKDKLDKIRPADGGLNILYGSGAALAGWEGPLVYLEVPKNEIQYRSRSGAVVNIGKAAPLPPKQQYKQFYFVDWVVLNKHKKALLPRIEALVDEQRIQEATWMKGHDLRKALEQVSRNVFRARPWFEAGAWGGNWIMEHIEGLPLDEPNYAWSFELITPENGIVLESGGKMLEISFDFLMYHDQRAVLGKAARRFGDQFPVRFDFLDTFKGGNLSVQCHPRADYIKKHFGENFTQDETYYILDSGEDACVYLGFQEDISPELFRKTLETSA
ncbi:MAG TPA: hypothetical protein VD772_04985, partial [Anseongella sp.]|nr:hypothetical protein [Anseongella sp.]